MKPSSQLVGFSIKRLFHRKTWLISYFSLCSNQMACLAVNPPKLEVSANGGVYNLHLANPGGTRIAFKFRSSNNNDYRLKQSLDLWKPEENMAMEVTRWSPKEDMLIIQFIEVAADVADPQAPFKSGSKCGEVNLPITAK
uniref:Major sperm protein n=1 Tax=Ditylenchus dipsaci TaxID=166011 RepID=A0A915CP92_9BILA